MLLRIKKKDIVMYCAFIILLFPYLQGSIGLLSGKFYLMMPIIAAMIFWLLHPQKIKLPVKELLIWSCILLPCLIHNYDLKLGKYNIVFNFFSVFLIYITTRKDKDWIPVFWNVVKIFCAIHFALGIFFLLNKNLLYSLIIPRFTMTGNMYNLLNKAISSGYMTGICNHYSKMGMYMALGTIVFAYPIYESRRRNENKSFPIILFLAFVIGLAITGKRGPLLFSIVALAIVFIEYSEKKMTKVIILRFFLGVTLLFCLVAFVYFKIPQVQSVIGRFLEGNNINEMANGRIEFFWIQALELFKKKPILGYGWGAFKAYSKNGNDAHNIYLQLLTETGVVGFSMVLFFFICSVFAIRKSIAVTKANEDDKLCAYLKVAYAYQIFFLLYGLTGNPLYDGQCYIPYLLSCAMGWKIYFLNSSRLRR